jgi:ribonuclease P/MRP protein subunit RPP1
VYHDLFVPVPKYSSSSTEEQTQARLLVQHIADRLVETGYRTMALTHTCYGLPRADVDNVDTAIPQRLLPKTGQGDSSDDKERKRKHPGYDRSYRGLRIVRRLHVVTENLSDVGALNFSSANTGSKSTTGSVQMILKEYDLVSVSPRNDAAFQAACSASEADIVTLDYTAGSGGVQLPYRIRAADIRAIIQRGAAVEIPYAPAIMNVPQRKGLVQTARALQLASTGTEAKLLVVISSGDRRTTTGESDLGAMVLRSPGDIINLTYVVLGFDARVAHDALGESGSSILKRGELRRLNRLGRNSGVTVKEENEDIESCTLESNHEIRKMATAVEAGKDSESTPGQPPTTTDDNDEYGALGDGFITLS